MYGKNHDEDRLSSHGGADFFTLAVCFRRQRGNGQNAGNISLPFSGDWKAAGYFFTDSGVDNRDTERDDSANAAGESVGLFHQQLYTYRHTKNRKAQVIPLCTPMIAILREYLRFRNGKEEEYLFCTETGKQLITQNMLEYYCISYFSPAGNRFRTYSFGV